MASPAAPASSTLFSPVWPAPDADTPLSFWAFDLLWLNKPGLGTAMLFGNSTTYREVLGLACILQVVAERRFLSVLKAGQAGSA